MVFLFLLIFVFGISSLEIFEGSFTFERENELISGTTFKLDVCRSGNNIWGSYKIDGMIIGFITAEVSGSTASGMWYEGNGLYGDFEWTWGSNGFDGYFILNTAKRSSVDKYQFDWSGTLDDLVNPPDQTTECIVNPTLGLDLKGSWTTGSSDHYICYDDTYSVFAMLDTYNDYQYYGLRNTGDDAIIVGNWFDASGGNNYGGAIIVRTTSTTAQVYRYFLNDFYSVDSYTLNLVSGTEPSHGNCKYTVDDTQDMSGVWSDNSGTYFYCVNIPYYRMICFYQDGISSATTSGTPYGYLIFSTVGTAMTIRGKWYEPDITYNTGDVRFTVSAYGDVWSSGYYSYDEEDNEEDYSWDAVALSRKSDFTSWQFAFVYDLGNSNLFARTYFDCGEEVTDHKRISLCEVDDDLVGSYFENGYMKGSHYENRRIGICSYAEDWYYDEVAYGAYMMIKIRKHYMVSFYTEADELSSDSVNYNSQEWDGVLKYDGTVTSTSEAMCQANKRKVPPSRSIWYYFLISGGVVVGIFVAAILVIVVVVVVIIFAGGAAGGTGVVGAKGGFSTWGGKFGGLRRSRVRIGVAGAAVQPNENNIPMNEMSVSADFDGNDNFIPDNSNNNNNQVGVVNNIYDNLVVCIYKQFWNSPPKKMMGIHFQNNEFVLMGEIPGEINNVLSRNDLEHLIGILNQKIAFGLKEVQFELEQRTQIFKDTGISFTIENTSDNNNVFNNNNNNNFVGNATNDMTMMMPNNNNSDFNNMNNITSIPYMGTTTSTSSLGMIGDNIQQNGGNSSSMMSMVNQIPMSQLTGVPEQQFSISGNNNDNMMMNNNNNNHPNMMMMGMNNQQNMMNNEDEKKDWSPPPSY